jgi:hypothetical protein
VPIRLGLRSQEERPDLLPESGDERRTDSKRCDNGLQQDASSARIDVGMCISGRCEIEDRGRDEEVEEIPSFFPQTDPRIATSNSIMCE